MKTGLFINSLLAAVATASPATADDPPPNGSQMIQYCDSENLQGPCTNLDDSVLKNCGNSYPPRHRLHQGLRRIRVQHVLVSKPTGPSFPSSSPPQSPALGQSNLHIHPCYVLLPEAQEDVKACSCDDRKNCADPNCLCLGAADAAPRGRRPGWPAPTTASTARGTSRAQLTALGSRGAEKW
ncbi:hypothetical protein PG988_003438 [Apiospora saccharicola]